MGKALRRAIGWVRKAIVWLLGPLGLPSTGFVVNALVGVVIVVPTSMAIAAFLIFLAMRAGPAIVGEFTKSDKFIPTVIAISIIVPAATSGLVSTGLFTGWQKGLLVAAGAGAAAIIPAIVAYPKLRDFQEGIRKDRPSETPIL